MRIRTVLATTIGLLAAALAAASAAPASADKGVALDIGKIEIAQTLTPGGVYSLPPLGVRNPGTEEARYIMDVTFVEGDGGRVIPTAWVTFEPAAFSLAPGATQPVAVEIRIPSNARPDHYNGLIAAHIAREGEGTAVGGAAAARVTFDVRSENLLREWRLAATDFVSDFAPWTYVLPSLLLAAFMAWMASRTFSLSLSRRR